MKGGPPPRKGRKGRCRKCGKWQRGRGGTKRKSDELDEKLAKALDQPAKKKLREEYSGMPSEDKK